MNACNVQYMYGCALLQDPKPAAPSILPEEDVKIELTYLFCMQLNYCPFPVLIGCNSVRFYLYASSCVTFRPAVSTPP